MVEYGYPFDDPEDYDEEEEGMFCDYGAEFCEDPFNKGMGLCTTECSLYFEMVKEQEKYYRSKRFMMPSQQRQRIFEFGVIILLVNIIAHAFHLFVYPTIQSYYLSFTIMNLFSLLVSFKGALNQFSNGILSPKRKVN